jgi:chorismate dehydratase
VKERIDLVLDYPAALARMLLDDSIDVGLIPVAVIPKLREYHVVSDYCIGACGPVASVGIFSECPMKEIDTVLLDYQSRTSAALSRILLRDHWKSQAICVDTQGEEYRHRINGRTAGLVIGDRALDQRLVSPHMFDLGQAWKDHTGLDFVFAAWVSNKPLDRDFIEHFNNANALGLEHLDEVIRDAPPSTYDLKTYYTENISYVLDGAKRKGMELFLEKVRSLP